jgi:hypothetical protein
MHVQIENGTGSLKLECIQISNGRYSARKYFSTKELRSNFRKKVGAVPLKLGGAGCRANNKQPK